MLNIPSSVKALFQTDGIHKNFRVHFPNGEMADITNDNVVQESVKFTESLCSQSVFKFGLAEASVLEFETVGVGNMYGMTIEASCEIDCSSLSAADKTAIASGTWDGTWDGVNEVFAVPYGVFRVESCPRNHGAMAHRQVTAYTPTLNNSDNFPYLPKLLDSSLKIRSRAIIAQTFWEGLTEVSTATAGSVSAVSGAELYTSAGKRVGLSLYRTTGQQEGMCQSLTLSSSSPSSGSIYDFAKFNEDFDADAYYQIGVAIANAIDAKGYNLLYNPDGTVAYSSTLEALKDKAPWLFYPCIGLYYYETISSNYRVNNSEGRTAVKVNPHELFPVITAPNNGEDRAFTVDYERVNNGDTLQSISERFLAIKAYAGENLYLLLNDIDGAWQTSQWVTITAPSSETISPFTVTRYVLDTANYPSGPYIKLNGQTDSTLFTKNNNGTARKLSVYQYIGQFPVLDYINGYLELFCKFFKQGRDGNAEGITLDDSSPLSIIPENYEEMWWDEYDVDPIGTVTITYQDDDGNGGVQEISTAITISNGASRYDMSENKVLINLNNTDLASVTSLINTDFAPYADDVAFTPTELTMQGWPWIEAGDALEITAEDGTTVDTYALRIEMSGIQRLTSVITAEGGEIIEEVS